MHHPTARPGQASTPLRRFAVLCDGIRKHATEAEASVSAGYFATAAVDLYLTYQDALSALVELAVLYDGPHANAMLTAAQYWTERLAEQTR